MKEYTIEQLGRTKTNNIHRVHSIYEEHKKQPVKLAEFGETLNLDAEVGETVLVMLWSYTETHGDYLITTNAFTRVE